MRLQLSPTSTARTRIHASQLIVKTAAEDGKRCSNVYEVNMWLWQFGRGKPRLGGLTIEETSDRQDSTSKSSDKRRKETREGCKGDAA